MITEPPTYDHVRAPAAAIRDGNLDPEQREHLITLLHSIGMAATLARQAQEIYPDNDAAALGYVAAAWEPVATAYAELAGTVRTGGGIPAS